MTTIYIPKNPTAFQYFLIYVQLLSGDAKVVILKDGEVAPEASDEVVVIDDKSALEECADHLKLLADALAKGDKSLDLLTDVIAGLRLKHRNHPENIWRTMCLLFKGLDVRLDRLNRKGELTSEKLAEILTLRGLEDALLPVMAKAHNEAIGVVKAEDLGYVRHVLVKHFMQGEILDGLKKLARQSEQALAAGNRKPAGKKSGHEGASVKPSAPAPAAAPPAAPAPVTETAAKSEAAPAAEDPAAGFEEQKTAETPPLPELLAQTSG